MYIKKVDNLLGDYNQYLDNSYLKNKALEILKLKERYFGKESKENISNLNMIGSCFYKEDNYLKAEEVYKRALEIDHDNIDTIQGLSKVYYVLGKYKECEEIIKKSLNEDIASKELSTKVKYLSLMDLLGELYRNKKDYIKCEKIYLRALDIRNNTDINMNSKMVTGFVLYRDKKLNEFIIDKTHNMKNISDLYYKQGRYEESEEWYKNLLEEIEFYYGNGKNGNYLKYMILNRLSKIYKNKEEYSKAEQYHKMLCKAYKEEFGEESEEFVLQLNKLASIYNALGKEDEANINFKKSMDIIDKMKMENQAYYAEFLTDFGNEKVSEGRVEEGIMLLEKALIICKNTEGIDSKDYASIVKDISMAYSTEEKWKDGEDLFKNELEGMKSTHGISNLTYAFLLKNFGDFLKHKKDYNNAEKYYIECEKVYKQINVISKRPMEYVYLFKNLGELYKSMENFNKAEEIYNNLLEGIERVFGKNNKIYYEVFINLGQIYGKLKNYEKSIKVFETALKILEELYGRESITYIRVMRSLADLYRNNQENLKELSILREALDLENKVLIDGLAGLNEEKKLDILKESNIEFNKYLNTLISSPNICEKHIYDAFDIVLLRKGMASEMMIIEKDILLGGKYPELKEELNNLNNLKLQIAKKFMEEDEKTNLEELKIQKEKLENRIAAHVPELELKLRLKKVKKEEVFKVMKEKDILIEFVKIDKITDEEERYIAFVIYDKGNKISTVNLGQAKKIDYLVKIFAQSIIDGDKKFIKIGQELRELLIDPLLKLQNREERIFICPDGELTKFPFHLLTYDSQYLFNYCELIYLNNSKDMIRNNILTKAVITEPVVVANPEYKNILEEHERIRKVKLKGLEFNELPYSKIEGLVISQKLGVNPYMGSEASVDVIKNSKSPKILHIAAHGYFILEDKKLSENPLLWSGLVLSSSKENDGVLTTEDISFLDLMGTELVVLSACETAMGEVKNGEGIYGLRRAFSLVGVKTIIMSLWEIDDIATAILMKRFYENSIDKKMDYGSALREAQMYIKALTKKSIRETLIENESCIEFRVCIEKWYEDYLKYDSEESKPFVDPYYWGAFICQGF